MIQFKKDFEERQLHFFEESGWGFRFQQKCELFLPRERSVEEVILSELGQEVSNKKKVS